MPPCHRTSMREYAHKVPNKTIRGDTRKYNYVKRSCSKVDCMETHEKEV